MARHMALNREHERQSEKHLAVCCDATLGLYLEGTYMGAELPHSDDLPEPWYIDTELNMWEVFCYQSEHSPSTLSELLPKVNRLTFPNLLSTFQVLATTQLFPTRVDHEKSDDAWTVKGIRQWHKMKGRGKSKQGKLSGHLSSNSHKASLDALNEFLQLLSDDVSEKVKAEIETAQFIAVTADTTPDASHLDQLSVVLRYVTPSRAIHERLLDMNDVDKKTGDGQALAILTSLRKKKLALNQFTKRYMALQKAAKDNEIEGALALRNLHDSLGCPLRIYHGSLGKL
eukprot:gene8732-9664_t